MTNDDALLWSCCAAVVGGIVSVIAIAAMAAFHFDPPRPVIFGTVLSPIFIGAALGWRFADRLEAWANRRR